MGITHLKHSSVLFLPYLMLGLILGTASAQDTQTDKPNDQNQEAVAFEPSEAVRKALQPLFSSIKQAKISRVTVGLSAESLVNGAVVDTRKSTYQIASAAPNRFTVYLKEPDQRTRIYCNGQSVVVAVAPDAYFALSETLDLQQAVTKLPIPLGPYPEAVLALSLAGVDPAGSFLSGMKSVEVVDRGKFRGKVPAVHFRGVQDDDVAWELWITQDKKPKPLRLLVDLTAMLKATSQVQVDEGFSYLLRFDFLGWRVTGKIDDKLFEFSPPASAKEYKSLDDYYQQVAGAIAEHELLGKQAPAFAAQTLDGKAVDSKQLKGKVAVIDFWATWCVPCAEVVPVLKEVTDKFADKDVVLLAVNVGEDPALIKGYLKELKWDVTAVIDKELKISKAYAAEAIPLTMVIGKSGHVESVHVGFPGPEALQKRLSEELEVLTAGGRIATTTEAEK